MASRGPFSHVHTAYQHTHAYHAVYALYGRSRSVFHTLLWAFIAEHTAIALCTILTAHTITWVGLCIPDRISTLSAGMVCVRVLQGHSVADRLRCRLPPVLFDALLLALTVYECTRGRWRRATLPSLLLRDGVWAFALVFCARVFSCCCFLAHARRRRVQRPEHVISRPYGPAFVCCVAVAICCVLARGEPPRSTHASRGRAAPWRYAPGNGRLCAHDVRARPQLR